MKTTEMIAMINQLQSNADSLRTALAARLAAANDVETVRRTARSGRVDQETNAARSAAWDAEEVAHASDPTTLWAQPAHSFWFEAAAVAIRAGMAEPS